MNKIIQIVASYILLVCISASILPLNIFHYHEEDVHCEIDNVNTESKQCHISIFQLQLQEHNCQHQSHLSELADECELCKFLNAKRHHYTNNEYCNSISFVGSQDLPLIKASYYLWNSSYSFLGRAPPIS